MSKGLFHTSASTLTKGPVRCEGQIQLISVVLEQDNFQPRAFNEMSKSIQQVSQAGFISTSYVSAITVLNMGQNLESLSTGNLGASRGRQVANMCLFKIQQCVHAHLKFPVYPFPSSFPHYPPPAIIGLF